MTDADAVNKPPHYVSGGIECIDYLYSKLSRDEFVGFLKGNVIKYLTRSNLKGDTKVDYAKAKWYLDKLNAL